jgi:hypothetical protein
VITALSTTSASSACSIVIGAPPHATHAGVVFLFRPLLRVDEGNHAAKRLSSSLRAGRCQW